MGDITREELNAFTAAHEKSAVALEKVANQLELIVSNQNKMLSKLENGISAVIIKGINEHCDDKFADTLEAVKRIEDFSTKTTEKVPTIVQEIISNSTLNKTVERVQYIVGACAVAIIVATVIIRGLDTRAIVNKDNQEMVQIINKINLIEKQLGIIDNTK